jgi:hypothetical protein
MTLAEFLSSVANTTTADLQNAANIANAATPPDTNGAQAYSTLLAVQAEVQKVYNAANPTSGTVGVFSALEIASLIAPDSAQAQYLEQQILTGCAAKIMSVQADYLQLIANGVTLAAVVP